MTAETILKTSHVKHLVSLPDHKQAQGIDKVIECMNDYSHRHAEVFALKRQFGISGLVTQEEMGVEA